jgi:ubiquinone biosynthesis protein COQ4
MENTSALPRLSRLRASLAELPALHTSISELRAALRSKSSRAYMGKGSAPLAAPAPSPGNPSTAGSAGPGVPKEAPAASVSAAAGRDAADIAALSTTERWTRALRLLAQIVANPDQTELVLEFLSLINAGPRHNHAERFYGDPRGQALYDEQSKIDSRTVDLAAFAALPAGTLGHAYAAFLTSHGLTPEIFDEAPEGITDPKLAYVVQRLRQTHDLWHVVTGCETDPLGEIALQAFTYAQVRAPGNAMLALAGTFKAVRNSPGILRDVVALYRLGARAARLPIFRWEDHWATPLTEVRTLLGLPATPRARAAA